MYMSLDCLTTFNLSICIVSVRKKNGKLKLLQFTIPKSKALNLQSDMEFKMFLVFWEYLKSSVNLVKEMTAAVVLY